MTKMFKTLVLCAIVLLVGVVWVSPTLMSSTSMDYYWTAQSRPKREPSLTDKQIEEAHNCKCVKYHQCDEDNYIIKNGQGLIDVRSPFKIHPYVCSEEDGQTRYCCFDAPSIPSDPSTISTFPKCGQKLYHSGQDLSVARHSEYPWMAAIFVKYHFVCTGALIHPSVVLTAAHYIHGVKNKTGLRVLAGASVDVINTMNEERRVIQFIEHPLFVADGNLFYDISILILEKPYPISETLNYLCLPQPNMFYTGDKCVSSGWSRHEPSNLNRIELPYMEHDQCQHMLRTYTDIGYKFVLHKTFICAGGEEGKDVCKGYGGSPLMCERDGLYYFVGIVSWGRGCGGANVPGVYTNVAVFREWIFGELAKRSIFVF